MAKTPRIFRSRLVNAAGALTIAGSLAVSHTGAWEGLKLYAYQDVVGIWTACRGETLGIKKGMKFTLAECDNMFIGSLKKHEAGMRGCLTNPDALPEKSYVAMLGATYNIGVGGFCGSSMARLINAGKLREACDALLKWNKAAGRVVKGLDNRRKDERKLCLEGLA